MNQTILEVQDLMLGYSKGPEFGPLTFEIGIGEVFALVGESGAGKSTVAFELMGVLNFKGGRRSRGTVKLHCHRNEVAYIPQDPMAALDPLFTMGDHIRERGCSEVAVRSVLEKVKLPLENISLKSYPHELSGGMLQRFLIGMALVHAPRLLIADEPTSSLDVIHQAEIMKLFRAVRAEGISILYITHNVPLAMDLCSRMAVLYKGEIVEMGDCHTIYKSPQHEFTQKLFRAVPVLEVS